jgi:glyoxylase-like metal-dependent hydrolase (beta-lactamase superfamily II)
MTTSYEIYALCPGTRTVDWSSRLFMHPSGQTTTSAYFLWALKSVSETILVDTGFTPRLGQLKNLPVETYHTREELCATAGINPDSVRTVILTHLHWDHFDLEGFLPNATFWVQKSEVDFFVDYPQKERWFRTWLSDSFTADLEVIRASGRLKLIEGNVELTEGVRLEWVGGHSPGMQIVVVQTARGPFVIANDALTTYRNLRDWIPPAIHINSVPECLRAMARIRELADGDESRICPGHDGEVLQKFPEVKPGVYRLA